MHGDELRAVGEGGFHLHFGDHFGDALHHVVARQDGGAVAHAARRRCGRHARLPCTAAVISAMASGVVELEAARLAALGQQGGGEDEQLVLFAGCQFHGSLDCPSG